MVDLDLFLTVVRDLGEALPVGRRQRDLLRFLANCSRPANNWKARTADKVAQRFGWNGPETAAKQVDRLRESLGDFYAGEGGRHAKYGVEILAGGSGAVSRHNNWLVEVVWRGDPVTRRFWQPHLDGPGQIEIISNAPLFHRSKGGDYRVRVMAVNDKPTRETHIREGRQPDLRESEDCYHYVSMGDFRFAQAMVRYFSEAGHSMATKIVHASRDSDDPLNPCDLVQLDKSRNLVAVGNRRVSWVVRHLEDHLEPNFFVPDSSQDHFEDRTPDKTGTKIEYRDRLEIDGCAHGLIVRSAGPDRVETLVNVQNGPALDGMARLLTSDELLEPIFRKVGWSSARPIPNYFELLFKVAIASKEVPRCGAAPEFLAMRGSRSRAAGTA